jgi:hypothetical protein
MAKADGRDQDKTRYKPKREIPEKCVQCSLMSMPQVREKHGGPDGCWAYILPVRDTTVLDNTQSIRGDHYTKDWLWRTERSLTL